MDRERSIKKIRLVCRLIEINGAKITSAQIINHESALIHTINNITFYWRVS
jgi:hypothetical protein